MVFGWFMATGGIGIDGKTFTGPFLEVVSFAQYLLPLAVLELYFWASKPQNKGYQSAVACLIAKVMDVAGRWQVHETPGA